MTAPARHPRAHTCDFEDLPTHWFGSDPFRSRLFDAFSTLLPGGERFFVESLRRAAAELADPALDILVTRFVQQQAVHNREHQRYNDRLREEGVDLDAWNRSQQRTLARLLIAADPRVPLAVTVALEHVTAALGAAVLGNEMLADAHATMDKFWSWHAAEEVDHEGIAFEVYRRLGGGPALRRAAMAGVVIALALHLGARVTSLLRRDGKLLDRATWRAGLRFLRGSAQQRGFASIVAGELAAYFRRDYHPWQDDAHYHLAEKGQRT